MHQLLFMTNNFSSMASFLEIANIAHMYIHRFKEIKAMGCQN